MTENPHAYFQVVLVENGTELDTDKVEPVPNCAGWVPDPEDSTRMLRRSAIDGSWDSIAEDIAINEQGMEHDAPLAYLNDVQQHEALTA